MKKISPILITGAAGFIGSALAIKLLEEGNHVIGVDNLNNYYDPDFKRLRLKLIKISNNFQGKWDFYQYSIEDEKVIRNLFVKYKPKIVVNLAAQAGVRYSLKNPSSYVKSNLLGFFNILDLSKEFSVENFIYASSSSVYGGNRNLPFSELDSVDHPINLYGATKKCNEIIAHSYSHIYNLPTTGLRFFTVYGPWGRPDMAPMIFANSILKKIPINIFNNGDMMRDFTYIDDIVESIIRCCKKPATIDNEFDHLKPNLSTSFSPYRIFNVGNGKPINLLKFIELLEVELNQKAIKNFMPMQQGDMKETSSKIDNLKKWIDYQPLNNLESGISKFANWYISFFNKSI